MTERWVFAYGSLMWDPGFAFEARETAILRGHHRAFSLLSTESWGSPERPGLVAALHPGGQCRGCAYQVPAATWQELEQYLQRRENAYRHVELEVNSGGRNVSARAFLFDREHPRAFGKAPLEATARLIAQGIGSKGRASDYLEWTVAQLALGKRRPPRPLLALRDRVRRLRDMEALQGRSGELPSARDVALDQGL